MSAVTLLAVGAVSALGQGETAFAVGAEGDRPKVAIDDDARLARAGFERPVAARVTLDASDDGDPAARLLQMAYGQCAAQLDDIEPAWRMKRVGLALGTSSGGMLRAESLFRAVATGQAISRELARSATYFGPLETVLAAAGDIFSPKVLVLGACASSTLAIGLAMRWLALGRCDIVLAGGFDAISEFVASGFESLHATTASRPKPFRVGRDGMALGEGAAVIALCSSEHAPPALRESASHDASREGASREGGSHATSQSGSREVGARASMFPFPILAGFGVSTDAVHITAPDRTGQGLGRAAARAIADANLAPSAIDLVSAHATATPFNDPAETRALEIALGENRPRSVHPFKAQIGHTLGAAGALESLAILDALRRALAPGAAGEGELDPESAVPLLTSNASFAARGALKLSSAFGGTNAALVFRADETRFPDGRDVDHERQPSALAPSPGVRVSSSAVAPSSSIRAPSSVARPVFLQGFLTVSEAVDLRNLAAFSNASAAYLSRLDRMARLVLTGVHRLSEIFELAAWKHAGLVLGHTLATLEQNDLFDSRRRERGPRAVEPRRFPATSPNAAAGECAIAFGLTGPTFGVGADLHGGLEALRVGHDLVAAGDATAMLVVAADLAGVVSTALLGAAQGPALPEGACVALLTASPVPRARPDSTYARSAEVVLSPEIPHSLARQADVAWAGPAGHLELAAYLRNLRDAPHVR